MKPREQAVEGDEAGFAGEDAIERGFEISLALGGGRATIGLEIAVELPVLGAPTTISPARTGDVLGPASEIVQGQPYFLAVMRQCFVWVRHRGRW
jgi:hypothetical protein